MNAHEGAPQDLGSGSMKSLTRFFVAAALIITFAESASAASDGSVGATSTGTAGITLTVPEYVKVTSMNNFALGSWDGSSSLDANDNINIAGNDDQGTPTYKVTLTGSGAASECMGL